MAARKFTMSKPLDETLASADSHKSDIVVPQRSNEAARDNHKSFPAEAKSPLANDTNKMSKPGITFASQDKLPKLPIPELDASLKKYLQALEPLQTETEHRETKAAVDDFLNHEGPQLQERLKKYAVGKSSYIEQFCEFHSFTSKTTKS